MVTLGKNRRAHRVTKRRIIKKKLRRIFPRLRSTRFQITSRRTRQYNCIAWAAGSNERFWDPAPGYCWPGPRNGTLQAAVQVYQSLEYVVCPGADLENGFEKIAVYSDQFGDYTHAARQLDSGHWTSKLGKIEDITHETLEDVECPEYGRVVTFLKRAIARTS